MMPRTVIWFSAGAPSAVATRLMLAEVSGAEVVYCETGSEHDDNSRFIAEVEHWIGKTVTRIRSDEFSDTWDVWTRERYISGINGAPCTRALKVAPRLDYQRPDDIQVFGYTADARDAARADRLRANYPELTLRFPLIERGLTKASCLAMVERVGIALPVMYGLGFSCNNCRICCKSQSPDYYALVRQHFPTDFNRLAVLSRQLGARLVKIDGERAFIDEIPPHQPMTNPIQPSCDFLCAIAEQDTQDRPGTIGENPSRTPVRTSNVDEQEVPATQRFIE